MKIFVITPMLNEASRYLHSAISNALEWADEVFVYDDGSDDGSFEVALDAGAMVMARQPGVSSFLEHEGRFRQGMWDAMNLCLDPTPTDWIFAIDADECLVADEVNARSLLEYNIAEAAHTNAKSCIVPVPEFFGYDEDGTPLRRMDGFWGTIAGTRLFRWQAGGRYSDKAMGSGAEPGFVQACRKHQSEGLSLCHYGYAQESDQVSKYNRYTQLSNHGHANAHVNSIMGAKKLVRWTGRIPEMARGDSMAQAA